MLGASWCDGNIVTIIARADTSSIASVERLIKGRKTSVPAPTTIKEYNQNMQGVDRNDQVRARFSVADGHSFKKWHKKLAFAVVDLKWQDAMSDDAMLYDAGYSASSRSGKAPATILTPIALPKFWVTHRRLRWLFRHVVRTGIQRAEEETNLHRVSL